VTSNERASARPREASEGWLPSTRLGKMVASGQITNLNDIFSQGYKIQEPEIVEVLLPGLQDEVINVQLVQKQTDAGERSRFKAIVAVGNSDGFIGLGVGKARQVRNAIGKGTIDAKLKLTPIRRGCGSWECNCGQPHSTPFKVIGSCGSVSIEVIPAPRGLGLVSSEIGKTILRLSGIKDCWTRTFGSTRTTSSLAFAIFDALRNTYMMVPPSEWVK
jgi:small subunit ribosomal protein S5